MFKNSYCLTLENFSKLFISYASLTNIQFFFLSLRQEWQRGRQTSES